jgi:hypothetical protein
MKLKVATITILSIGMLVATVGMIPSARKAVSPFLSVDLFPKKWVERVRGSADTGNTKIPTEIGSARFPAQPSRPASGSDAQGTAVDRRAAELLAKSIEMLEQCPSVSAKTRQSVHLYGKHLVGSGEYLEQKIDGSRRFRVEFKMQIGNELRTLLHVCDGRYLWRCESYKGKGTAERIDLARVARALEGRAETLPADKSLWWTRLGGLSELLRDLRDSFDFISAGEAKLADQTPVTRLEGTWKADRLATLVPRGGPRPKSASEVTPNLPEHLPDRVVLFLGRDDLFPFRVEYRRRGPQSIIRGPDDDQVTVAMDLYDVTFNAPRNSSRFVFTPGNLEHSDQTDRFLERLGVAKKP